MNIRISGPAQRDLKAAFDFIYDDNPKAAMKMSDAILASVRSLAEFPLRGRTGRIAETRELVVRQTGHIIGYLVRPDEIIILRVLHGRQNWPV